MVSLDPDVGEFDEADVLIDDGEILEVGTGLSASNAEEIDAAGTFVVPGLVDSHMDDHARQAR